MTSPAPARQHIDGLLLARDYEAALAAATEIPAGLPGRDALLRRVLARMGRFEAAAEHGRRHLASGLATIEDRFRQAQILLRCGLAAEALPLALDALEADPADWRPVVPIVEAALLDPALERVAARRLGVAPAAWPPAGAGTDRFDVLVPALLPHYAGFEGRHPTLAAMVGRLRGLRVHWPERYPAAGLPALMLARLGDAGRAMEGLLAADDGIDAATAARYVAARFPALLVDPQGARVDLLQHLPLTLGERPFLFLLDILPMLVPPLNQPERVDLPRDDPGLYRILRHVLRHPSCHAILTLYRDSARQLATAFDAPDLAAKCVFVSAPPVEGEPPPRPRRRDGTGKVTLLFASSAMSRTEQFYMRGGVEVIEAFLALAGELPQLHLILRSALPRTLSPRLRAAVAAHPRIDWRPEPVPWPEYGMLLDAADIFACPSVATFRNGLVQAMQWGMAPIVADCLNIAEFVTHDVSGVVVPGRRPMNDVGGDPPGFRGDWEALYRATNGPADADFHARFREALRALATDPARLSRISAHNIAHAAGGMMGPEETERLNQAVQAALRERG